jgi:hypothetical protein
MLTIRRAKGHELVADDSTRTGVASPRIAGEVPCAKIGARKSKTGVGAMRLLGLGVWLIVACTVQTPPEPVSTNALPLSNSVDSGAPDAQVWQQTQATVDTNDSVPPIPAPAPVRPSHAQMSVDLPNFVCPPTPKEHCVTIADAHRKPNQRCCQ